MMEPEVGHGTKGDTGGSSIIKHATSRDPCADPESADMTTLLIIGSRDTHMIARPGRAPLVYTSRSASAA